MKSNRKSALERIDREIMDRLDTAGERVVALSKPLTPVSSEDAEGHVHMIQVTDNRTERVPEGWRAVISNPKHYAIYVHEGTRYQHPQPFLTPVMHDPSIKAALRGE